jgi:predicted ABC-class ATPase
MQDMVKQIVDMDRKAREITDAAQLEKVNSEKEVAQKREEIRAEYLERARKRISLNEPKERAAAEAEWQIVMQKNTVLSQNLDNLYSEKGDEWVKSIVARVIGE